MATKTLHVMATDKAEDRVILYEHDEAHPDGELFIRGYSDASRREVVKVGDTAAVRNKIHDGLLVETTAAGKVKATE